jgi:hypothetical protein
VPAARYHAIVLAPESEARQFAAGRKWEFDKQASEQTPDGTAVMRLDKALAGADQLSDTGLQLGEELADHGLRPVGMVANIIGDDQILDPAKEIWLHTKPHAWETGPIQTTIPIPTIPTNGGSGPPSPGNGDKAPGTSGETAKTVTSDAATAATATATKADTKEAAPSDCCEAQVIKAALGALAEPASTWAWADAGERGELARKLLSSAYADRSKLSEKTAWLLAPEMVLLDQAAADTRTDLAEELLRSRGKLTEADTRIRESRADLFAKKVELEAKQVELEAKKVELAGKEVELAGKNVDLAEQGVGLAAEMLAHMQKWRAIADWGIAFLVATTVFSMVAVAYVLLKLMPDKEVSDVAAPIIVFVLAVFAISPAVLLLRERPLEGIDKWSPGGGAGGSNENGEGNESGDESEKEGEDDTESSTQS